jgi:hypothetical protein
MDRLTYYDYFSECYKIRPNAPQGEIIQTLGAYEDNIGEAISNIVKKALEQIEAEKLNDIDNKTEWQVGFNEGLEVAEGYIKGALYE